MNANLFDLTKETKVPFSGNCQWQKVFWWLINKDNTWLPFFWSYFLNMVTYLGLFACKSLHLGLVLLSFLEVC